MKVYVQFSDKNESEIIATFGSPQDPGVYLNYGEIDTDDPRLTTYLKRLDAATVAPK